MTETSAGAKKRAAPAGGYISLVRSAHLLGEKWDVRILRRQMESALFLRLAVSRDKEDILALAQNGVEIQRPEDVIKNTYTLEFLNLPELDQYSEGDLETCIINNL